MTDTFDPTTAFAAYFTSLRQLQHDVFLSYSWASDSDARRIYDLLSPLGKVFFAPNDITAELQAARQYQFAEVLIDALQRSAHFVGLVTPQYLDSSWCQLEMNAFLNIVRKDRARTMWLFELTPGDAQLDARLRGMRFGGSEQELVAAVGRELGRGVRRKGFDLGGPPPRCLRELPLRPLYPPPTRAPWRYDSQSRGMPGAPPYEVYEALVREYMIQIRRRGGDITLEIAMDGLDPRHRSLTKRAREDAQLFLANGIDPYADAPPPSEQHVLLRRHIAEHGESERDLLALAWCLSLMGPNRCEEALAIAERALASGAEATSYRRVRARAAYSLRRYAETVATITGDAGPLFLEDHLLLAAASAQLGRAEVAAQAAAAALAEEPRFNCFDERIDTEREDDADIEHWLEGLARAGLPARPPEISDQRELTVPPAAEP